MNFKFPKCKLLFYIVSKVTGKLSMLSKAHYYFEINKKVSVLY